MSASRSAGTRGRNRSAAADDGTARLAQNLLHAQVRHLAAQCLDAQALRDCIDEEVDAAFVHLAQHRLREYLPQDSVRDSVQAALALQPAATPSTEFTVALLRAVFDALQRSSTRFAEHCSETTLTQIVEHSLSLQDVRRHWLKGLVASPVYAAFVSELLFHGIRGYLEENPLTRAIPGAQSMLRIGRAALSKAGRLESALEDGIKHYLAQAVQASAGRSVEFLSGEQGTQALRESLFEAWRNWRGRPLRAALEGLSAESLAAYAMPIVDILTRWRHDPIGAACAEAAVQTVYARYGDEAVTVLLSDCGLTREYLSQELLRWAAPLLQTLHEQHELEAVLRRRLRSFYESEEFAAALR